VSYRSRHQFPFTLTCAWNAKQKTPLSPAWPSRNAQPRQSHALRSLRLRHTPTRYRTHPNLRVCQLVKVSRRNEVTHVYRRWPVATPASGSTDPHVWGIALFPEPGDFTASSGPCQGRFPRTEVPFRRRASSHHGRLAAARRGRLLAPLEPNEYRTFTSLCQVLGPSRFRSGSPRLVSPAGNQTNIPPAKHYVKWVRLPVSRAHAVRHGRLPPDSRAV
jgi:hypothetical protein